jgi:DNA-binding LytR/AlgR family response regulator
MILTSLSNAQRARAQASDATIWQAAPAEKTVEQVFDNIKVLNGLPQSHLYPTMDLVFLDVRMPGLTGLQVLENTNHGPAVVFTTAYDDHAVTAFELEALDYILKPFGRERFRRMLTRVKLRLVDSAESEPSIRERALQALDSKPAEYLLRLFVRDRRGRVVHVRVGEVTRLVGADDYVELLVGNASYLVKVTLNEFEKARSEALSSHPPIDHH